MRVVRASTARLVWAKVPHAGCYNVQLYHGAQKLLSAWPVKAKLTLAPRWAYQGRAFPLEGVYRWYVWPGFGDDRVASTDTCSARRRSSYA